MTDAQAPLGRHDSRRPRVALYDAYPHLYAGSQRATHVVAHELPRLGWDVHVLTPGPGQFVSRLQRDGVEVTAVNTPHSLQAYGRAWKRRPLRATASLPQYWSKLAGILRHLDVDVLQANDHRGLILAGPAARLARVPLVWHIHFPSGSRLANVGAQALAQKTVVASTATIDDSPGLRAGSVAVIPYPLTGAVVDDDALDRAPIVVCAARIHPDKGLDVLLEAAAKLRADIPSLSVLIAGDEVPGQEAYAASLRDLRARFGLEETVQFLGFVEDMAELRSRARVYVQPSRREPFGLAAAEAMAAGVPVVASATGGLDGVVEGEVTGILVPPGDPSALARAIHRLIDDEELAARLVNAARESVVRRFGPSHCVELLAEVYRAAMAAGRRR